MSHLPKTIPGWHANLRAAYRLLQLESSPSISSAVRLLDAAVGIVHKHGISQGRTLSSYLGLKSLPLYLVRRIEYEAAARRLNMSEMEISKLHSPFVNDRWYIGDVLNRQKATDYLLRSTLSGNRFAYEVLQWLSPETANGVDTTTHTASDELLRAIRDRNRDRAVQLGRVICTSETPMGAGTGARPDATVMLRMNSSEQRAMSANNIGYWLAHGTPHVEKDIAEAIEYFQLAIDLGSSAACVNMALLYHNATGNGTIRRNGARAKELYEMAIKRGERNYAPRNLAVLLRAGAPGVKGDVAMAARMLLLGISEGNDSARQKCVRTLKMLLRGWRIRFVDPELKQQCVMAVQSVSAPGSVYDNEIGCEARVNFDF